MTRSERNEFNYICRSLKKLTPGYGSTLTIRISAGSEYKLALHEFYTSLGFHPASITKDRRRFDGEPRIIYIYGLTWTDIAGYERSWTDIYPESERRRFKAALG